MRTVRTDSCDRARADEPGCGARATPSLPWRPSAAVAVTLVLLAGCGGPSAVRGPDEDEAQASSGGCPEWPVCDPPAPGGPDVPTSGSSSSPTPDGACPTTDGQEVPAGCVAYDGRAAMRLNEAYRQRAELAPSDADAGRIARDRIQAELEDLAQHPLTAADVERPLARLGHVDVQAYGRSDEPGGLAVGVSVAGGCVYGSVRGSSVELRVGGMIADGGCLPAPGH